MNKLNKKTKKAILDYLTNSIELVRKFESDHKTKEIKLDTLTRLFHTIYDEKQIIRFINDKKEHLIKQIFE